MFQKSTTRALSQEIRISNQKTFRKSQVFPITFCQKTGLKFVGANAESHEHYYMNRGVAESYTKPYTLEVNFQMKRTAVKLSQRAKTLKKLLYTQNTLATLTIYNRAYSEKLVAASPSIILDFTKSNLVLLFVQQEEKSLGLSTRLEGTYVSTNFVKSPLDRFARRQNLHQNPLLYTLFNLFRNLRPLDHFEARWKL